MDRVSPIYIPRNHRVEEALAEATGGEMGPFRRLVDVISRPFDERPGLEDYVGPALAGGSPYVTYCGT
jgi:serine/tyrosine/threonine adenylyltransferase